MRIYFKCVDMQISDVQIVTLGRCADFTNLVYNLYF